MTTERARSAEDATPKGGGQEPLAEFVKASFNFPREELEIAKELASRRRIPVTQVLRQAIASELFLQRLADEDSKVLVQDEDGNVQQVVFNQTQSVRALTT